MHAHWKNLAEIPHGVDTSSSSSKPAGWVPSSPVDRMESPVSRQLRSKKFGVGFPKKGSGGVLDLADLEPCPCPCAVMELVLGSSSSSRKQVFDQLQWKFSLMKADIDEKAIRHKDPLQMPLLIAQAKAAALIDRLAQSQGTQIQSPLILVTADQIVLYEDQVREKPETPEQAREFLRSYSRSTVRTISAVLVTHLPSGLSCGGVDVACVEWGVIGEEVVERVVQRGNIFSRSAS
ncbi:inosine triphosphate pyrophosphatase-like protein, partial [Ochromonadaceae sp. CCMP2298]